MGLTLGLSHEKDICKRDAWSQWWDRIVPKTFTEEQWVQNFRMRKETFDFLCSKLEHIMMAEEILVWQPLDVQTQFAVALYWLASSAEYHTVSNMFGLVYRQCLVVLMMSAMLWWNVY